MLFGCIIIICSVETNKTWVGGWVGGERQPHTPI